MASASAAATEDIGVDSDSEDRPYVEFSGDSPTRKPPTAKVSPTSPAWHTTNENVRDLHKSITSQQSDGQHITTSKSIEGMKLAAHHRLHPDVGTASELAQPGGFRRAHINKVVDEHGGGGPSHSTQFQHRATPLLKVLEREGFVQSFVTAAVQRLDDGTEVRFESRPYRRGSGPMIVRTATGEEIEPRAVRLVWVGFLPTSVPYWSSLTFLVGSVLFTEGSFVWFAYGEESAPAWAVRASRHATPPPPSRARDGARRTCSLSLILLLPPAPSCSLLLAQVAYPFFLGGLCFLAGCYLAFVEVINANLSEDLADGSLAFLPSTLSPTPRIKPRPALYWWRFQPKSLLWWGAFMQLAGALLFQIALCADLPQSGLVGFEQHARWSYGPCTIGSICFLFASYVYLLEVAADPHDPWRPPAGLRERLGYVVAMCNLGGSAIFVLASLCYFCRVHTEADPFWDGQLAVWEYEANEWGVRFLFGVGSLSFVVGSVCAMPELLSQWSGPTPTTTEDPRKSKLIV